MEISQKTHNYSPPKGDYTGRYYIQLYRDVNTADVMIQKLSQMPGSRVSWSSGLIVTSFAKSKQKNDIETVYPIFGE